MAIETNAELKKFLDDNKKSFFDLLRAAGVTEADAEFSGSGDSGQFDVVAAYGGYQDGQRVELKDDVLLTAIEEFCSDILWAEYGGWENNDGASGTFEIDVEEETVKLEIDSYFTSSDHDSKEY